MRYLLEVFIVLLLAAMSGFLISDGHNFAGIVAFVAAYLFAVPVTDRVR